MKITFELPEEVDFTEVQVYTKTKLNAKERDNKYEMKETQEIFFENFKEEIIAKIEFSHYGEHHEKIYPELVAFDNYGETKELTEQNYMQSRYITIEFVYACITKIGGKGIPCYSPSPSNGMYFSNLSLKTFGFIQNLSIEDVSKKDEIC